jgi:hypothetical protein
VSVIRSWLVWPAAVGVFGLIASEHSRISRQLGDPNALTGWILLILLLALASFNARKRLSMLPLGSARTWLLIHVAGGGLAAAVFWLHIGTFWPQGFYEQALTVLFYAISANGILGYLLQRIYPARLTQTGLEVIYERIPSELADIRGEAEALILACTKETASDVLAQHYQQTFSWFFRRPRFTVSHLLGGLRGEHWVRHQCSTVQRYLNAVERGYLERLASLARIKNQIDFHYAAQGVMKGWLLVHVPLAVAVLALAAWHVILVHIYAR